MTELSQKFANINLKTDDSVASKEIALNVMDNSLIGMNMVFRIRRQGTTKTTKIHNFTSKHCNKLKTITYNGKTYSSLYKPKDDEHALYIHQTKGKFIHKSSENSIPIINDFVNRINELIEVDKLEHRFKKHKIIKIVLICLMSFGTIINGIYMLLLLLNILFWVVSGKSEHNRFYEILITQLALFVLFFYYKFINYHRKLTKFIIFKHILKRYDILDKEIENWNFTYFYSKNQKAVLADTFDYIQIFSNKSIVYEFQEHK